MFEKVNIFLNHLNMFSELIDIYHENKSLVVIVEEKIPATPTNTTATVTFPEVNETGIGQVSVTIPIRRCSSISKLANTSALHRDSGIASGATGSFSDVDYSKSPTFGTYSTHGQVQSAAAQSASDSLPLERFRPRSKSAHQSNALRQSKQLQKVPEVIQALKAPTAGQGGASEPSATDELYRSRLLRCNFLLKLDAIGYEYARHVQKLSHSTYSYLFNSNPNDYQREEGLITEKNEEITTPFHRYTSKLFKKIYRAYNLPDQHSEKFTTDDGYILDTCDLLLILVFCFYSFRKFSSENRDLDDADEDGNTIYRGLAVPVDIRQVIEVGFLQIRTSVNEMRFRSLDIQWCQSELRNMVRLSTISITL